MMHNYWGYGGGYDVWGLISMFLVMVLLIIGVVLVVRYFAAGSNKPTDKETALDILKQRYAKGEIDKKEFEEKRKDLKD